MHGLESYIILFGIAFVIAGALYSRRKLRTSFELQAKLHKEFDALRQEKKVIYDFLHDLGEAFTEEIDREHLLRIIVNCARNVTGAKGAAIYLWDADREKLMAAIVSGTFPPVLKVDNIVADQLSSRAENLEAFLRLEAVPADSTSVIGEVAHSGKAIFAERTDLDDRFPWFRQKNLQTVTYMAVPLHYRQEQLGVLALANHEEEGKNFTKADFELVQSVADQAAYSLQHAQIYNQLSEKKRLDHEIEVAREVQRILLPSQAPEVEGYNCAALNIRRSRSAAIISISSASIPITGAWPWPTSAERASRPRLSWRCAAASCEARRREISRPRRSCAKSIASSTPTSARTCSSR